MPDGAPQADPTSTDALELEIAPVLIDGPAGGYVLVSIGNRSDTPFWINERLRIGTWVDTQLSLDVTDVATGSVPPPNCRSAGKGAPISPDDYVALCPGKALLRVVELDCSPGFSRSGPSRIVAHYHDRTQENFEPPIGVVKFVGAITSNAIEMTVKSK